MIAAALAREAFLAARRRYLGGTDVAAIVGVSPWATPLSVYIGKVAPEAGDDADTLPMRRGHALERFIADEFERARPGLVCFRPHPCWQMLAEGTRVGTRGVTRRLRNAGERWWRGSELN